MKEKYPNWEKEEQPIILCGVYLRFDFIMLAVNELWFHLFKVPDGS